MQKSLYAAPAAFAAQARFRTEDYERDYAESVRDPEAFWGRMGGRLDWVHPYAKVKDVSFDERDFRIRWFPDGQQRNPDGGTEAEHDRRVWICRASWAGIRATK